MGLHQTTDVALLRRFPDILDRWFLSSLKFSSPPALLLRNLWWYKLYSRLQVCRPVTDHLSWPHRSQSTIWESGLWDSGSSCTCLHRAHQLYMKDIYGINGIYAAKHLRTLTVRGTTLLLITALYIEKNYNIPILFPEIRKQNQGDFFLISRFLKQDFKLHIFPIRFDQIWSFWLVFCSAATLR